ncbi:MAG TPA: Fe-S cluster assembly protein SufD, partial [Thermoanaerobaculia bacterium]|nr:Fe-S cluster assembly protein SufD [Thermoanaerobaculia bacterium]
MTNAVDTQQTIRDEAAARFQTLGWPTTRDEAWKYTNLAPIARIPWKHGDGAGAMAGNGLTLAEHGASAELVFVNGALTSVTSTTQTGVTVTNLREADVDAHFARYADYQRHALTALNTAEFRDGAYIEIANGAVVDGFIHLLFIGEGDGVWSHPRNLIVAGRNAQVTIVESYVGNGSYFTNAVTELVAADGAVVDHYKVVTESDHAFHVGTLQIHAERSANVTSRCVTTGGLLVRNEINAALAGEGASLTLDGLFVGAGTQHIDNHTVIEHAKPHCDSIELYKGILDERARGIFDGTIIVREGAVKTASRQTNKNLLLSETAIVDSKPTLEIYNDDVKCNHGSTIGQLDENQL